MSHTEIPYSPQNCLPFPSLPSTPLPPPRTPSGKYSFLPITVNCKNQVVVEERFQKDSPKSNALAKHPDASLRLSAFLKATFPLLLSIKASQKLVAAFSLLCLCHYYSKRSVFSQDKDFPAKMSVIRGSDTLKRPPRPKSPPIYPDLCGSRRESAKIRILDREIGFLEEELKDLEGLPPASKACKEVAEFVAANADPLIPKSKKSSRLRRIWKWLWCPTLSGESCFNMSSICCWPCHHRCQCIPHVEMPQCSDYNICDCSCPHVSCQMPKFKPCSCWKGQCFNNFSCSWSCCFIPEFPSVIDWPSCSNCFSCLTFPSSLTFGSCLACSSCFTCPSIFTCPSCSCCTQPSCLSCPLRLPYPACCGCSRSCSRSCPRPCPCPCTGCCCLECPCSCDCSCPRIKFTYPKCPKVNVYGCSCKTCSNPCYYLCC